METFFSIIIPLHNKQEYIKSTINSVLNQTFTNYEIIVVDDGSTDNSPQIVKSIKDSRIIFYSKVNEGVSSARNFGITKSRGEYICFLDGDDLWTENYLETLNTMISKNLSIDMICSAYAILNEKLENNKINIKGNPIDSAINVFKIDFFTLCLKQKRCIAFTSATCIKKKIIIDNNLCFEKGINLGEDIDFWTRTACFAKNIFYNNQIQVLYRSNTINSLSNKGNKMVMCYPYWEWYNVYYMQSPNIKKFTTRMIYTLCREGYKRKEYSNVIHTIKKSRGSYLILSRFALLTLSLIKKYVTQN